MSPMMDTSDGSPIDGKSFLENFISGQDFADMKENQIRQLRVSRMPMKGDYALRGKERRDIKEMADLGIIKI